MTPTATVFSVATAVLGPLTTTFTPPPACTVAVAAVTGKFLGLGGKVAPSGWLGQTCSKGGPVDDTSCWPPISSGAEARTKALDGWGYYSPGLHCPAGYATACSATGGAGAKSDFAFQFAPGAKETAVGCCPSVENGQTCVRAATSTEVEYVTCDGSDPADLATMTISDDKDFMFYAPLIQINWQSSDRPTETVFSGTVSLSVDVDTMSTLATAGDAPAGVTSRVGFPSQSVVLVGSQGSNKPTGASEGSKEEDGVKPVSLSTGFKVGMAVAGGVLAVAIVAIIFICAWRRRKQQIEEEEFDRMYGMKDVGPSTADFRNEEIPGWHRGPTRRQPPAPVDPFRSDGESELMAPPAPYHPPSAYRQCQDCNPPIDPIARMSSEDGNTVAPTKSSPSFDFLRVNRKLRHLRGIYLRNLAFTRQHGRTIDDAALNKTAGKLEALRERPDLHHTLSSEDLRPPAVRRRSTHLANADPATRQKSFQDTFASKLADAFFTLHVDGPEDPIYISEVAERATDQWSLLLEDKVDLRTLNWLGTLQNVNFPPNSLVFHMVDGIYSLDISNKYPPPKKEVPPLPTSSYNVLMRLATLNNSIQDALATRDALAAQINDLLAQEEEKQKGVGTLAEAEEQVKLASKYLSAQKRIVAAAKKHNDDLRASIAARQAAIESGLAVQRKAEEDVHHAAGEPLAQSKALLSSVRDQIRGQRRRICEDLLTIYRIQPIPPPTDPKAPKEHDPLSFQICSLPLANTVLDPTTTTAHCFVSSPYGSSSLSCIPKEKYPHEESLSASLGLVALLVHHLQLYLSVPLPYPIKWHGSRSTIRDDISNFPMNPNASSFSSHASQSSRSASTNSPASLGEETDPSREFPLFLPKGGSTAQYRFEYAWFLLNRNIEVLCWSQGLKVVDIRHTLPNLQWLLMVCSAGKDEVPERKRGGVRGLWLGRIRGKVVGMGMKFDDDVDGSANGSQAGGDERGISSRDHDDDDIGSRNSSRSRSRRGSTDSDAATTIISPRTTRRTTTGEGGGGGGGGLTIGYHYSNGNGTVAGARSPLSRSPLAQQQLPFDEGSTKLTLRTKGLRESVAR
ncbi:p63 related protein [Neurospora crassa]|nr:p63 related protein [Neurospora crassa]